MRKVFKWLGITISIILIIGIGAIGYIVFFLPDVGAAPSVKVSATPERIERGRYLATSVTVCIDCHSERDWTQFAGPYKPGTEGGGGEIFDEKMGFPGTFQARNITPYGLKDWTDGEIYRAITSGVTKDGEALFPVMPYHYYGTLDTEDIYSIIAYLRTLPPIERDIPKSEPAFPFNIILHTIPTAANPKPRPAETDVVAHGEYLVRAAGCVECHTPAEKGTIIAGQEFSGGRSFEMPGGTLTAPNITPHTTGIGAWTEEQFVSRFKMYADSNYQSPKLAMTDFNTIMPWLMYAQMKESDLKAIYQYLKTLEPKERIVERFVPRTNAVASSK